MVKRGLLGLLIPFLLAGVVLVICKVLILDPACPAAITYGPVEPCDGIPQPMAAGLTIGLVLFAFLVGLAVLGTRLFPRE